MALSRDLRVGDIVRGVNTESPGSWFGSNTTYEITWLRKDCGRGNFKVVRDENQEYRVGAIHNWYLEPNEEHYEIINRTSEPSPLSILINSIYEEEKEKGRKKKKC